MEYFCAESLIKSLRYRNKHLYVPVDGVKDSLSCVLGFDNLSNMIHTTAQS